MKIELRDGLPFVTVRLRHGDLEVELRDVVLDTGSAGTVFSTEDLAAIGLVYEPEDPIHRIHGVGGSEFAFLKRVDLVSVGTRGVQDFGVEVSAMDYGFDLGGILGTDFLVAVGAVINLSTLELE
jgi:hypothetical protein